MRYMPRIFINVTVNICSSLSGTMAPALKYIFPSTEYTNLLACPFSVRFYFYLNICQAEKHICLLHISGPSIHQKSHRYSCRIPSVFTKRCGLCSWDLLYENKWNGSLAVSSDNSFWNYSKRNRGVFLKFGFRCLACRSRKSFGDWWNA